MKNHSLKRVSFFLPSLGGGGAERATIRLIEGLISRGVEVDLVLSDSSGPLRSMVPKQLRMIDLKSTRTRYAVLGLVKYLRESKPELVVGVMTHSNLILAIASLFALYAGRQVYSIRVDVSECRGHRSRLQRFICSFFYKRAFRVLAVSKGAARSAEKVYGLSAGTIRTVFNGVEPPGIISAEAPHLWLSDSSHIPVFLSVGRIEYQKNFSLLLRAFALLRNEREARLLIIGDGPQAFELEGLALELGVSQDVDILPFQERVWPYMKYASCFVLSSRYEGFPNVLLEALSCGTQVVSTDSKSGPSEILEGGKYGRLVPIDDERKLWRAMGNALDSPIAPRLLQQRAAEFSVDHAVTQFLDAIDD